MRILSDEEDERFRQRVRDEIGFHHEPGSGWEPVEMKDVFTVPWSREDYDRNEEKMIELVRENTDSLFLLAFEEDQYVPAVREEFNEKYGGKIVEITPEEIREVSEDLITLYLLPEDMNWIILRDHDASIHFSGEIKEQAEQRFQ